MHIRRYVRQVLGFCAASFIALASAQTFPAHPIHLIVTYPPGGASDLMARLMGQKLGEVWKQTVIIENKPGAAGSIGTEYAARKSADGYTVLFGNIGPSLINPLLSKVPFEMDKDFVPVSLIATGPVVLVVNSNSPYKTLDDLISAARKKSLNFGSGGTGSMAHLVGEMINHSAKVKMQHVPYKGGIMAINDLLAGTIDMVAADPPPVMQLINSGRLRALAVTSQERSSLLPDVPSFAESGMAEVLALESWGIYLPTATPKPVIDHFRVALDKIMVDPNLVKRFSELGVDALHSTAAELRMFNESEIAKYGKLIKDQGIRAE